MKTLAILSGAFFGSGAVLLKSFMENNILPVLVISLSLGLTGFLMFQYALKQSKSYVALLIMLTSSTVISTLGGVFYLSETVSMYEFVGVVLIVLGAVPLIAGSRKE